MKQYWFGVHCESQWTSGSSWKMVHPDGRIVDAGEIVAAEPPRRLVIRWQHQDKPELKAEGESLCTMELEPSGPAVKLFISHTIESEPSKLIEAVSGGWPKVISNLKSPLEMADGEQIHSAMYPGSIFGDLFSQQTEVNIRQHALESASFVVCATAWLDTDQLAQIAKDTGGNIGPLSSGCFTAIVAPDGSLPGQPIRSGEGVVVSDLDFTLIDKRKQIMDSRGHYSRPEFAQSADWPHSRRVRSRTHGAPRVTR